MIIEVIITVKIYFFKYAHSYKFLRCYAGTSKQFTYFITLGQNYCDNLNYDLVFVQLLIIQVQPDRPQC